MTSGSQAEKLEWAGGFWGVDSSITFVGLLAASDDCAAARELLPQVGLPHVASVDSPDKRCMDKQK